MRAEPETLGPLTDDLVLPFRAEASGVMGRVVRLGAVADRILKGHDYPEPVLSLLCSSSSLPRRSSSKVERVRWLRYLG